MAGLFFERYTPVIAGLTLAILGIYWQDLVIELFIENNLKL